LSDSKQSNSDKIINHSAEPGQDDRISEQHEPELVSVIIPTYNREAIVCRAIQSILNQSNQNFEIIVIDDGYSDNTAEIIPKYAPRARYVYQENAGASAARNRCIQEAKGEWAAFLDSDDEWFPDKLKLQTDLLLRNIDLVWPYTNYLVIRLMLLNPRQY
jgi:glycosyltransferase involved in cell wall biosynthesis